MCGVVGAFNIPNPYETNILMADSLPHRGENGAGIGLGGDSVELFWERSEFNVPDLIRKIKNKDFTNFHSGIGHVRYGTAGDRRSREDAQPLYAQMMWGSILLAHNGDSPFMVEDRQALIDKGLIFTTSSDSEIMLHHMALAGTSDTVESIKHGLRSYRGTYALGMLVKDRDGVKLIAARDPSGNRPLSLGRLNEGYLISSEDSAFETVEGSYERDIAPGELLVISKDGLVSENIFPSGHDTPLKQCVYENIYFSLPTSKVFGIGVGEFRTILGRYLAKRYGHLIKPGDIITYVPDSANFFASGFSDFLNRRLTTLIIRRHTTRSFIQESQMIRDDALRRKFSFHRHKIRKILNKNPETRVWLIDDSIVRGNTSKKIIRALRGLGFQWVGILSSAPVITGPCHKGIDMPGKEGTLISVGRMKNELLPDNEKIAEAVEANFVGYLPVQDLYDTVRSFGKKLDDFCFGCFENRDPIWGKW